MAKNKNTFPGSIEQLFQDTLKSAIDATTTEAKDEADIRKAITEKDGLLDLLKQQATDEGYQKNLIDVRAYHLLAECFTDFGNDTEDLKAFVSSARNKAAQEIVGLKAEKTAAEACITSGKLNQTVLGQIDQFLSTVDFTDPPTREALKKKIAEEAFTKIVTEAEKAGLTKAGAQTYAVGTVGAFITTITGNTQEIIDNDGAPSQQIADELDQFVAGEIKTLTDRKTELDTLAKDLKSKPVTRIHGIHDVLVAIETALKEKEQKKALPEGADINGAMRELTDALHQSLTDDQVSVNKDKIKVIVERIAGEFSLDFKNQKTKKTGVLDVDTLAAISGASAVIFITNNLDDKGREAAYKALKDHVKNNNPNVKDTDFDKEFNSRVKRSEKAMSNNNVLDKGMQNPRTSLVVMIISLLTWLGLMAATKKQQAEGQENGEHDEKNPPVKQSALVRIGKIALPVIVVATAILTILGARKGPGGVGSNIWKNEGAPSVNR